MLQIRLSTVAPSESGGGPKPLLVDNVTVACPDHLVLADLPVAKGIGAATAATVVKTVGRRSRRLLGERVHFCVRCDFPISIYGRLSPCEHAFCLDCARSDPLCYLCDERIQKIQTIKLMEGIFICAAPHCLKSFLKRMDFEAHIHESHADLLQPNTEKEEAIESEVLSTKVSIAFESTVKANPRPELHDRDDRAHRLQPRDQQPTRPIMPPRPPFVGQMQNYPGESQNDSSAPPGFERPPNHFQQGFDTQGTQQQESSQQGVHPENPFPEYPPMHSVQPPNFAVPMNANPVLAPPYAAGPFQPDGTQPFYGAPFEMARQDSAPEGGSEQGSLLGFPPGPAGAMNFAAGYPQLWNTGAAGMPYEGPPSGQMNADGFAMPDSQGKVAFYQGDYGRSQGGLQMASRLAPANNGMEAMQGNNMDPRDGKGILAPQSMQFQHQRPPPLPSHIPPQYKRTKYYSDDHEGARYGWQHENRDAYGSSQD